MKVQELFENGNLGLTIFDIDDTLFRTTAQIKVVKDGKVVKSLNNQEFNTYKLQPGESFDFGEFRNAEKFNKESIPIQPMIAKLKAIINNAGDSKVIMLTARSDFDNKELFLDTFKKYGIDMSRVHVHRAGNLGGSPSQNKAVWIRKYLDTGKYARVRLYDDAISNIKMFINLQKEYPDIKFFPYFVTHDGGVKTVRETRSFQPQTSPLQALVMEYLTLTSFGLIAADQSAKTPAGAQEIKKVLQTLLQSNKNLQAVVNDKQKLEANRTAILKNIHDMMTYAIAHLKANLTDEAFNTRKKQLNSVLIKYNDLIKNEAVNEDGRVVKGVNTTVDVGPDEIKRQAAKFGNTVDKDGRPPTMSKAIKGKSTNVLYNLGLAESQEPRYTAREWAIMEGGHSLEESKPRQPGDIFKALSEYEIEDRHPNEKPLGPEFKPTMPKGTIRVKVSDVYDWYKLGQHISDLEGLGKHDFGQGPPEAIISFGSEEQEHKYIELLKKLGLEILDVDPGAADAPGVETDPTYNTENFADGKKPGRKGLSKRVGIPKGASVTQLRKIAKNSTGERRRMAHWQANMKSGRKKK